MAIVTVFATGLYRLDYDSQYGVCWYTRLKDDQVTAMNTGIEANEERDWAKELNQKDKQDCTTFNSIAAEHSFSPRWSE